MLIFPLLYLDKNHWFQGFSSIHYKKIRHKASRFPVFIYPPKAWIHPVTEACCKHGNVHFVMKTGDKPVPCMLVVLLKRLCKFLIKIKIIILFILLSLISLKILCCLRIHETTHTFIYSVAKELVFF